MKQTVHIIEVLETTLGTALIVRNNSSFSVGQRIRTDDGNSYIIKRINLPTNPEALEFATLIV